MGQEVVLVQVHLPLAQELWRNIRTAESWDKTTMNHNDNVSLSSEGDTRTEARPQAEPVSWLACRHDWSETSGPIVDVPVQSFNDHVGNKRSVQSRVVDNILIR